MGVENSALISTRTLADWVRDARQRTLTLLADLGDDQLRGLRLAVASPPLWELGRLAWFQEKWVLRRRPGWQPVRADADELYDPAASAYEGRWELPLPSLEETLLYLQTVHEGVLRLVERGPAGEDVPFILRGVFEEDIYGETFLHTRQTLGTPPPYSLFGAAEPDVDGPLPGDVMLPGGQFLLGASANEPFAFDNERAAHPVNLKAFFMARAPVTQSEFANFVDRGGYYRPEVWSLDGWQWRQAVDAKHPMYWKRTTGGTWLRRQFDQWVRLEPHRPMMHVNWFEAEAYCRWTGRRLPTEAEWEYAAAADVTTVCQLTSPKRRFPWGDDLPDGQANLDARQPGPLDVAALPAGDAPSGCRQMLGNVWEWTASEFLPYPGFVPGPDADYSQPHFGTHKVLRGGCWATRGRLLRNTFRRFCTPCRSDVWAGFRTCAR